MHIALYNKTTHVVEYIEEHDDPDLYIYHHRLVVEAEQRGPEWSAYRDERPFDWDIVDHQPTAEEKSDAIRAQRNSLLAASDWTQIPDADLTATAKTAWREYRQALRDLPSSKGFPESVTFPEAPDA
jgi:hypothetical protein